MLNFFKRGQRRKSRVASTQQNAQVFGVGDSLGYYDQDNLKTRNNHDFMNDSQFRSAYARGVEAAGVDYHWHWRVHVGIWAAQAASRRSGDFVECGVGNGFLASAIMHYLNWNELSVEKRFILMDTFAGIDSRYLTDAEVRAKGDAAVQNESYRHAGVYASNLEGVQENFNEWRGVEIVDGPIPETLDQVDLESIAFLHIDMNCIPPEVAAFRYFWPMLVSGGVLLLDDYAYFDHQLQKDAMDAEAEAVGHSVLSLPTGQGLIIKA